MAVNTHNYSRTNTAVYVSDKVRNLMKLLILRYNLDPTKLMDAWTEWVQDTARQRMESGHLRSFVIEFYRPGAANVSARWDFPVRYDGTDIEDMWTDPDFLRETFAKTPPPPADCIYRILLERDPWAPTLPGIGSADFLGLGSLKAREAGTVVGTPDIMASARYYR